MKYLIFSDSHITEKFDEPKFNFIKEMIKTADKVVISGDFYDGILTEIDKVLNSKWKILCKLLKKKRAIFIPGNHDPLTQSGLEQNFCDKITDRYEFKSGGKKFIIEHGHKATPGTTILERFVPKRIKRSLIKTSMLLERFIARKFKWNSLYFYFFRYVQHKQILKYKHTIMKKNDTLILGHIHLPYSHKNLEYINSGCIMNGLGSYVTVENGKAELHKETY